jgi:hypothetical protein
MCVTKCANKNGVVQTLAVEAFDAQEAFAGQLCGQRRLHERPMCQQKNGRCCKAVNGRGMHGLHGAKTVGTPFEQQPSGKLLYPTERTPCGRRLRFRPNDVWF